MTNDTPVAWRVHFEGKEIPMFVEHEPSWAPGLTITPLFAVLEPVAWALVSNAEYTTDKNVVARAIKYGRTVIPVYTAPAQEGLDG